MYWVATSYHFDYFIRHDLSPEIWNDIGAYDHPKLAQYSYGMLLYSNYIKEKNKDREKSLTYTQYLVSQGVFIEWKAFLDQARYREKLGADIAHFKRIDSGDKNYFIQSYGNQSEKTFDFIQHARYINVLYMTASVIIVFFISKFFFSPQISFGLTLWYAYNNLFIQSGIVAHSEALFILLFLSSLYMMFLYIMRHDMKFFILSSVFAGLCMSTKLNGSMLLGICIPAASCVHYLQHGMRTIKTSIAHAIIFFLIMSTTFVILNPYVYQNPIKKTLEMFHNRKQVTRNQIHEEPHIYIPPTKTFSTMIQRFFTPENATYMNAPYKFSGLGNYANILAIFFVIGIIRQLYLAKQKHMASIIMLCYFLATITTTSLYLNINWERYFVHLLLFVLFYQTLGVISTWEIIQHVLVHKRKSK
jgi:hypothetical protein